MIAWLLLLIGTEPVPMVGRPADYSGVVGGPFNISLDLADPVIQVGKPFQLTLRIIGHGDFSNLRRPDLRADPEFSRRFSIEDGDTVALRDPSGLAIHYRLRAIDPAVDRIPRVKFVYFNPNIRPASRGFQTTYADARPIVVESRPEQPRPMTPEVAGWLQRAAAFHQEPRSAQWTWLWPLPPIGCVAWMVLRRRSIAASPAAHIAMARLRSAEPDVPRQVADVVAEFFRERVGLSAGLTTPAEISAFLYDRSTPLNETDEVRSLLARCDEWRYARPDPDSAAQCPDALLREARQLVMKWDRRP